MNPQLSMCNCAATPPTIPLYRDPHDHLPDCPMASTSVRVVDRPLTKRDHNFALPADMVQRLAPHSAAVLEAEAARGGVILVPEDAQQLRSALSYAVSLVDYHAPLRSGGGPTDLAAGAANCKRWLVWLKDALK